MNNSPLIITNLAIKQYKSTLVEKKKTKFKDFKIVPAVIKDRVVNKLDPSKFSILLDFDDAYEPLLVSNLELTDNKENEETKKKYEVSDFKINDLFFCVIYKKIRGCVFKIFPLMHINYDRYFFMFSNLKFNFDAICLKFYSETIMNCIKSKFNIWINKKQKLRYYLCKYFSLVQKIYVSFNLSLSLKFRVLGLHKKYKFYFNFCTGAIDSLLPMFSNRFFNHFFYELILFWLNYYIKYFLYKAMRCIQLFVINILKTSNKKCITDFYTRYHIPYELAYFSIEWQLPVFDRYLLWRIPFFKQKNQKKKWQSTAHFLIVRFTVLIASFLRPYYDLNDFSIFTSYNLFTIFDLFFFYFNVCCNCYFYRNIFFFEQHLRDHLVKNLSTFSFKKKKKLLLQKYFDIVF